MNYTVIAYQPDGEETCRGCVVSSWGSELQIRYTTNRHEIPAIIAETLYRGLLDERSWEYTILINGVEVERHTIINRLMEKAKSIAEVKLAEWQAQEDARRAKAAEEARQRQQERDLETLTRLKAQYEGVTP